MCVLNRNRMDNVQKYNNCTIICFLTTYSCFLSLLSTSPACYRIKDKGLRLTSSPTNITHKYSIVNTLASYNTLHFMNPCQDIVNTKGDMDDTSQLSPLANSWSTTFMQIVNAGKFLAISTTDYATTNIYHKKTKHFYVQRFLEHF
jgi:hypothetical protein